MTDAKTIDVPPQALESVATILEEEIQPTIDDWYERLSSEEDHKITGISKSSRCSHLPNLFTELIHRLRNPRHGKTTTTSSPAATAHGLLRLHQGFPPAVLIEESRCLQVSIFNTLNTNAHRVDFNRLLPDVMIIADEVDAQLAMAMASYASGGAAASVVPVAQA